MSWQLASVGLIAVVLVGGGVWYERSRPPARLVAMVAALAALAVAGRLVLAPVPNVVATTDVVLLTGFSLGAAPGFAVGALAGLVSNIWLGQGPWTPWQMAGWGMVGIGGALLARLTLRRAGRFTLAIAAGVAGLSFGALLDLSVMVNFGGEQSLDRYLALSTRGIPFNIAHALGNVALIWAAGPAIVRMLERYRVRSSFVWHPAPSARGSRAVAPLASFLAMALLAVAALSPAALAGSASNATDWLRSQQNADGGWGNAPGDSSSPAMTTWVILGLEAAGIDPRDVRADSDPLEYLRRRAGQIRQATDLERTILALEAAGADSRRFAGRNLVDELIDERSGASSWRGGVNPTAFGVMALSAAGAAGEVATSLRWLERAQNDDGGWGFNRGVPSDPDSTGAALQALGAGEGSASALRTGARYLRRVQRGDGGFPAQPGLVSNSQSTAWATQGLAAAGVDPAEVSKRQASPIDFLRRRQAGDGHVAYSRQSDQTPVWVTAQAVMGFEEAALPLPAVAKPRAPKPQGGDGPAPPTPAPQPGPGTAQGGGGNPSPDRGGNKHADKQHRRGKHHQTKDRPSDEDARDDRVVVNADAPEATVAGSDPDTGDEDGPNALITALAATAIAALLGGGFWLYRRFF